MSRENKTTEELINEVYGEFMTMLSKPAKKKFIKFIRKLV